MLLHAWRGIPTHRLVRNGERQATVHDLIPQSIGRINLACPDLIQKFCKVELLHVAGILALDDVVQANRRKQNQHPDQDRLYCRIQCNNPRYPLFLDSTIG